MTLLHCVEVEVIYYRCFSLEFKALGTRWCDCSSRGGALWFYLVFQIVCSLHRTQHAGASTEHKTLKGYKINLKPVPTSQHGVPQLILDTLRPASWEQSLLTQTFLTRQAPLYLDTTGSLLQQLSPDNFSLFLIYLLLM